MALRWKAFAPQTPFKAVEAQDLADNGVVQVDAPADLDSPNLVNVNMVFVASEMKVYKRKAAGVGAVNFGPFEGGGLAWAKVSGGTVTEVTNADGSVDQIHTFTENGTLTVESPGYARVLLVGAGGQTYQIGKGNGGRVRDGIHPLPAGTHAVAVADTTSGATSRIGDFLNSGPSKTSIDANNPTGAGGTEASPNAGLSSDITGTMDTYGEGASSNVRPNHGDGQWVSGQGSSGVVIVRVQRSAPTVSGVAATGGTVAEFTGDGSNGVAGQKYRVHTFTIDTPDKSLVVAQGGKARILVCGTGGYANGGPGNGGQVIEANYDLAPGTLPVVITNTSADVGEAVGITGLVMTAQTPGTPPSGKATGAGSGITGVLTDGYTSTITGTPTVYGPVGDLSKFGGGAPAGPAAFGARGCVIVRYEVA